MYYTYVPALISETTEGLIQIGGTFILVNIKSFGNEISGRINNNGTSFNGISSNNSKTSWEFRNLTK